MECYVAGFVYGVIANYVLIDEVKEQEGGGLTDFLFGKKELSYETEIDTEEEKTYQAHKQKILLEIERKQKSAIDIVMVLSKIYERVHLEKLIKLYPNSSYTEILKKLGENLQEGTNNRPKLTFLYREWKAMGRKFTENEQKQLDKELNVIKNAEGYHPQNFNTGRRNKYFITEKIFTKTFPCTYWSELVSQYHIIVTEMEELLQQLRKEDQESNRVYREPLDVLFPDIPSCITVKCDPVIVGCIGGVCSIKDTPKCQTL